MASVDRPTADMSEAAQVMATLDQIQQDLALRQNLLEQVSGEAREGAQARGGVPDG
jgi:hypothetical protein